MTRVLSRIQHFLHLEASAGIILMFTTIAALIISNSVFSGFYSVFLNTPITVAIGSLEISKALVLWINDGLMAIFFFLVGLEIKREVLAGELSSFDKAILPVLAAIGGMAGPALVFAWFNWGSPETISGWAIPAATDIAFALGILALLGSRVPVSLKVFLLAIAIIDDLGAILIIAIFYSADLSVNALTLSMLGFAVAVGLNRMGVRKFAPYIIIGIFMWVCVLKSGVHATLAGVLIALTIPLKEGDGEESMVHRAEHGLHPWVAFLILPLFAFANAGVSLAGLSFAQLLQPLPLGIAAGLFVGKQVGVFGITWLAINTKIARLPENVGWRHVYGVACLTGVGFTMSLFIGSLAFSSPEVMNEVRLGVLSGSILSGLLGFIALYATTSPQKVVAEPA
ncbi:Na+/H+ antiporter NhaA [Amylibacter sp. SFDW26]|uniref:Na+/H+ antiporter NhaA n=1 Tax=Amylibacter sp. SFDW26 TaxID=2652722 RepID=UPI0012629830|nr:Na+/H+ antiporter NhaA [Amylibacter sp. SFDW26]KAB7614474.1 Na+/H+ antiporter NhaA [Amylibacter sp. SFDW26]